MCHMTRILAIGLLFVFLSCVERLKMEAGPVSFQIVRRYHAFCVFFVGLPLLYPPS